MARGKFYKYIKSLEISGINVKVAVLLKKGKLCEHICLVYTCFQEMPDIIERQCGYTAINVSMFMSKEVCHMSLFT